MIYECRCDERLKDKNEGSTRLTHLVKIICFYYETIKRELEIKPISECRCDKRIKTKSKESTCLSDTGFSLFIVRVKR